MDDVGVVFSGDLVSDVTAAADALGVSYTTMDETVEACEEALFEKARRWVQEGLKKQREERIRKRPKKERRRCNPIVAAFFESVNNPQADEWDLDFDTPIPLRPFLTKAEREARETVAARVRKRRRS